MKILRDEYYKYMACLLLLPCQAIANEQVDLFDLDLEELMQIEVVSSASRYEQSTLEAPSSVTVVSRKEILALGYRTISEAVRGVRGFYTTDDRNYNYTGVRGFGRPADYDTRLLVLVNGHRMNEGVYDSSPLGLDFILDIDLVERIEIVRGPSSSLYGTNAFFGVVNVITREANDINGLEVSTSVGEFDSYKGRASYGKEFANGLNLVFSATRFDSEGENGIFFEEFAEDASGGSARNLDTEDGFNIFSQLSTEHLTLDAGVVTRSKLVPTGSYGTIFNDPRSRVDDDRIYVDLKYKDSVSDSVDIELRGFYDWYSYEGDFPYDYSDEGDGSFLVVNRAPAKAQRWGASAQTTVTALEGHKVVAGAEVRHNFKVEQKVFDEDPFFGYLDDDRDTLNWGLYVQDEYRALEALTLQAGLRFDEYEGFSGEFSPRASAIWAIDDKTALKFLFGKAFRAPNAFELYYRDGGISLKSNENLKPENIYTYEVVLEHYFEDNYRLALDVYHYRISDLISQEIDPADGLGVFSNKDEVKSYGAEVELEGRWAGGWRYLTSYSYQETEDQSTERHLSNSPRHLWKNKIYIPFIEEQLHSGIEVLYTSSRGTITGGHADDYWLTNATLNYQGLIDGLSISGSLYNLFDEDYRDPGSTEHTPDTLPQYGRTWRIKLTYNF